MLVQSTKKLSCKQAADNFCQPTCDTTPEIAWFYQGLIIPCSTKCPPPFLPNHHFSKDFPNPFFPAQKKKLRKAKVLVCNVQGIGDAISHKDNKTQDFQNTNSPSHQNLKRLKQRHGRCFFRRLGPH